MHKSEVAAEQLRQSSARILELFVCAAFNGRHRLGALSHLDPTLANPSSVDVGGAAPVYLI